MSLAGSILAHLLDANVPPPLHLTRGRFQWPSSRRPWLVERTVVDVREKGGPAESVFRHLEEPVTQGRFAVTTGVSQRVGTGQKPEAEIESEPRSFVVIGVAIKSGRISRQNVFQMPVGQVPSFGAGNDHQTDLRSKHKTNYLN